MAPILQSFPVAGMIVARAVQGIARRLDYGLTIMTSNYRLLSPGGRSRPETLARGFVATLCFVSCKGAGQSAAVVANQQRVIDQVYAESQLVLPGVRIGSIVTRLNCENDDVAQWGEGQRFLVVSSDGRWARLVPQPGNHPGEVDWGADAVEQHWIRLECIVSYSVVLPASDGLLFQK